MNFCAVILAGGKSSRMGRDKARLEIDGKALLVRQIQLARECGAAEIFISGPVGKGYEDFGCPILTDRFPECGPLAGVERCLVAGASSMVLVLAVDMPHLAVSVVEWLKSNCSSDVGAIPQNAGKIEPLAAFYPKSAHRLAEEHLRGGRLAMKYFALSCVAANLARLLELPPNFARQLTNWNSPQDLLKSNAPSVN